MRLNDLVTIEGIGQGHVADIDHRGFARVDFISEDGFVTCYELSYINKYPPRDWTSEQKSAWVAGR